MFDTKIAIIIRDDLATWQKLNVTAFLMSGITGANPALSAGSPGRENARLRRPMMRSSPDLSSSHISGSASRACRHGTEDGTGLDPDRYEKVGLHFGMNT